MKHIYTMLLVILGWVFFRSDTVADGMQFIGHMFGIGSTGLTDTNFAVYFRENIYYFLFGILFSAPLARKLDDMLRKHFKESNALVAGLYSMLLMTGMLVSLAYLIKGAYNPFIYFNF